MRTIEYALVTLLIGAVIVWGASALSNAIAASFHQSAAAFDRTR